MINGQVLPQLQQLVGHNALEFDAMTYKHDINQLRNTLLRTSQLDILGGEAEG